MTTSIKDSESLKRPLFEGIHLSDAEIASLDRIFTDAKEAQRNTIDFAKDPGVVAFTPGAALAIGVANLAFAVYTEYGKSLADRFHIQTNFKQLATQLAALEDESNGAASVDVIARLRNDLREARGGR